MKLTSSTANALTQLLPMTRHADGISVAGMSIRLRNGPENLQTLVAQVSKINRKTLATLAVLMSAKALGCSDDNENIYISDKEHKNNYLISKMNTRFDLSEIIAGICNTEPTINKDDRYIPIKNLSFNPWTWYELVLSRGKDQPGNPAVEECLLGKLQEQMNHPSCEKDIDTTSLILGLGIAIAASLALLAMAYGLIKAGVYCSEWRAKKNLNPEEGEQLRLLDFPKQQDVAKKTSYATNQLTTFKPVIQESQEPIIQQEKSLEMRH